MEQKALSKWLKVILIGVGLVVYFIIFPSYGQSLVYEYPEFLNRFWPWLIFLWVSGIPCYAVLVLGWKIAANIGRDNPHEYVYSEDGESKSGKGQAHLPSFVRLWIVSRVICSNTRRRRRSKQYG